MQCGRRWDTEIHVVVATMRQDLLFLNSSSGFMVDVISFKSNGAQDKDLSVVWINTKPKGNIVPGLY